MKEYFLKIYQTRYFWIHLSKADLKYKFRRSKLGILWTLLNPLLLTVLMTVVFGTVFKMSYLDYAPYILSGLVVWELLSNSVIAGGNAILSGETYIRQCSHPVSIYPLKSAIVYTISFLIGIIGVIIWVLFSAPQNIILGILTLPLTTIMYFFLSWPTVIIASFINTKYRDYPQVMALIIQALWYVSPVFFKDKMFKSSALLEKFFNMNPITHILNLVREPFLYGKLPSTSSYLYVLLIIVILTLVAHIYIKKNEKDIIFYL